MLHLKKKRINSDNYFQSVRFSLEIDNFSVDIFHVFKKL
jgi:hypothetical protein